MQQNKYRTSTEQVQDKYPTSTRQVPDKLDAVNPNIIKLVQIIGEQEMTVKDLMTSIGLKDRENFLNLYLNPAISEGYVRLLYPQSPRHPRQKYLLTAKGLEVLKSVTYMVRESRINNWTFASEYSFTKRLIYTFDRVYGT